MDDKRVITILSSLFIVFIIMGASLSLFNPSKTYFGAEDGTEFIDYSIYTNYGSAYSSISMNSDSVYCTEYTAFYDETYPSRVSAESQRNGIDLLRKELGYRGIDLLTGDAETMKKIMEDEMDSGTFSNGLIFLSGSIPKNIYDGTEQSLLIRWLRMGGAIFWTGEPIGKYYSDENSIKIVPQYEQNFFGTSGVVREGDTVYSREDSLTGLFGELSIYYSECTNGINVSNLTEYVVSSYSHSGYHAVSMSRMFGGDGLVAVFGGKHVTFYNVSFIAQAIASGISYDTVSLGNDIGVKNIGEVSGKLPKGQSGNTILFMFLGDFEVNVAKRFAFI